MIPPTTQITSTEDIQKFFDQGDVFGVVALPSRPGWGKFITRLEHEHYDPYNEDLNDLFQLFVISHSGLDWMLIGIPIEHRPHAERIAKECDLRFADGLPMIIGGDKIEKFPIQHKNIWSAENLPGSEVYSGKATEITEAENKWLKEFFDKKDQDWVPPPEKKGMNATQANPKHDSVWNYIFEWMTRTSPKVQNVPPFVRRDIHILLGREENKAEAVYQYLVKWLGEAAPDKTVFVEVRNEIERILRD